MIDLKQTRDLVTVMRAQAQALDATAIALNATANSLEASLAWLETTNSTADNYEKVLASAMNMWTGFLPKAK